MLAYVQWVGGLTTTRNGLKSFRQWGAREVINTSAIDRCVGFFKLGSSQYVIIEKISFPYTIAAHIFERKKLF